MLNSQLEWLTNFSNNFRMAAEPYSSIVTENHLLKEGSEKWDILQKARQRERTIIEHDRFLGGFTPTYQEALTIADLTAWAISQVFSDSVQAKICHAIPVGDRQRALAELENLTPHMADMIKKTIV